MENQISNRQNLGQLKTSQIYIERDEVMYIPQPSPKVSTILQLSKTPTRNHNEKTLAHTKKIQHASHKHVLQGKASPLIILIQVWLRVSSKNQIQVSSKGLNPNPSIQDGLTKSINPSASKTRELMYKEDNQKDIKHSSLLGFPHEYLAHSLQAQEQHKVLMKGLPFLYIYQR